MASGVRVKHKNAGYYELRRAPGVVAELERRGTAIREECGEGYEMSSSQGAKKPQGRWHVRVYTRSTRAKRSNRKNHTLLKALAAGGGS